MSNTISEDAELKLLSADDLDHVSGGLAQVLGGIAIGIATNAIYDWLKSPGTMNNKEFLRSAGLPI
jgi:hypothetical protein